jgi:hypothetical protein
MAIDRIAPDFFTGVEVENSPAKGMPTLFVVGLQPIDTVLEHLGTSQAYLDKSRHIRHVYIGANMSLHSLANDDHYTWRQWDSMIEGILESGKVDYITVDLTSGQVEGFLESTMSSDNRIIPMISVKLPYTGLLNYNTTIKIDDRGFNETNPGVWCHSLHKLLDRDTFTPWHAYVGDNPVK